MANLAGAWALADALESMHVQGAAHEDVATVTRVDPDGSVWVRLLGTDVETPVNGAVTASVAKGQQVLVRIEDGRLSVLGNPSEPSVGASYVERVVVPVERVALSADAQASAAHDAAQRAEDSAETAAGAAQQALTRAGEATRSAADAAASARDALQQAGLATEAASTAQASAERADRHANDALNQLSVVEDVAGTLRWISDHGSYVQTTDTSVRDGTVYFELSDGEYIPIAAPSGNPRGQGWYVLDVESSQSDYIMAHLAVTSAGLWVIPSGITYEVSHDESVQRGTTYYELVEGEYVEVTTEGDENPSEQGWYVHSPRTSSGYKLLLANDGAYLYDDAGRVVTTYGESIRLDSSRPQYVGGEDAYVMYYDSDGDGAPDSIMIGGSNVTIGSASLSEVVGSAFDLYYDHTFTVSDGIYTFNACVYMGGEDVTRRCDPDFFVWWLRTEAGDTFLGRGWSIDVDSSAVGYNASVLGGVEDALVFTLADANDYEVVDSNEDNVETYMTLASFARGPRE